ncbi:MAG TPA: PatA/PatG family cyanobactin maturation protease, partial [Candidatus Doudnabacteria bacterium]|nr:PatA/PatG family cyanobactin maturation protease [Candidatus Doudnabacteria bacterium]
VFSDRLDGSLAACFQLGLAQAIEIAVQAGAHIVNISLGQYSPTGAAHPLLAKVVGECVDRGVLLVAAAGNEGCECLCIPGALPSVLAVGAMDAQGLPLEFSNWGGKYQTQGILAPGKAIPGANPGGGMSINSGTSYATPIVFGVVALLASLQLKQGRRPNLHAVREALLHSAQGCEAQFVPDCRRLLAGRLNIAGALSLLIQGVTTMSNANKAQELPNPSVGDASTAQKPRAGIPAFGTPSHALAGGHELALATEITTSYPSGSLLNQRVDFPNTNTGCGCSGAVGGSAQWVFALGKLGYDFGVEARRDSILEHMQGKNPQEPTQLLDYLERTPWDAAAIIWTLNLDATPIYAIKPCGAFAGDTYQRLRVFLREQIDKGIERVSIPGTLMGSIRLMSDQVVPVIQPDLRGMYSWNTADLIKAVYNQLNVEGDQSNPDKQDDYTACKERVENFFVRAYEELHNLGIAPQDRAINYAATNALLVAKVFKEAIREELVLGTYAVERSPICRPESDCWDVKLTFFNPSKLFEQASKVYLFTVDVGDVVPVMVGPIRSWFVYVRP